MRQSPLVLLASACWLFAGLSCNRAEKTPDPANLALSTTALPDPVVLAQYLDGFDGLVDGLQDETTAAKTAWAWFLALNAPESDGLGVAWERTFQQDTLIYLPAEGGVVPEPVWEPVRSLDSLPDSVVSQARAAGMDMRKPFHELAYDQQSDGKTLVSDFQQRNVRYQILVNRAGFDYIRQRVLYSRAGQVAAAQDGPFDFPADTWELKTSWIWVPVDAGSEYDAIKEHYYLVNAWWSYEDPATLEKAYEVGYAAMSGMHIINKFQPRWIWVTFENARATDDTQVQRGPGATPTEAFAAVNDAYRELLRRDGSVLANYEAIGLQWQFTEGSEATILANTQIESAFQENSSCISCHAVSSIAASGEDEGAYWNMVDPTTGALNYYVGVPPLDQLRREGYVSMDSVWSLRHAH